MLNQSLNKVNHTLKKWIFPTTNEEINREIDSNNLRNARNISLALAIIQLCSVIVFLFADSSRLNEPNVITSIVHVSASVVIFAVAFIISNIIIKKQKTTLLPRAVTVVFIIALISALIIWGEIVSVKHYANNQQMLTFFTVELSVILFVKLRPIVSILILTISSWSFFFYLNFFVKPGMINPYNYGLLFLLITVSSIHIYGHTINNIKQRNRIELLNNSLRIIADHDRMTRLNNRYALERRIPEFLNKDICVGMLDINKFKAINDTYGHPLGDEVLKLVADKILEIFPGENIFRYGGDEFLVIEPNNGMDKFLKKFKHLNKNLVNSRIGKYELTLQCCYGCVSANVSEPKDFMDIISQADKKLYIEKQRTV